MAATNVFIHGVGQVTGEAKTDIELLSSSDLVSDINGNWPYEGVFYEVNRDALNRYYDYMFGSNSGLVSSDFDSTNIGLGASDVADHIPILYIKDLVTDMTTDNTTKPAGGKAGGATDWWANYSGANQKIRVLVDDSYDNAPATNGGYISATAQGTNVVGLQNGNKLYNFIDCIIDDIQRIFGAAFDTTSLKPASGTTNSLTQFDHDFSATSNGILSHQEVATEILNNFMTSGLDSVTDLRIENVEELQQLVDSSDGEGHEFDNHFDGDLDNSNRTLSALFLHNDIFRFQNGVKFTFTVQIPDYNPKEIYTKTDTVAVPDLTGIQTPSGLSSTAWEIEELTEFGSHTDFRLTFYQNMYIVVKD